mmetsp:Transcript_5656/g.11228  ORF Transcript_5656/g.11228 Transcript_5656/m.11228 type:complete len:208 (-) Transcript_5656:1728-2351(-)
MHGAQDGQGKGITGRGSGSFRAAPHFFFFIVIPFRFSLSVKMGTESEERRRRQRQESLQSPKGDRWDLLSPAILQDSLLSPSCCPFFSSFFVLHCPFFQYPLKDKWMKERNGAGNLQGGSPVSVRSPQIPRGRTDDYERGTEKVNRHASRLRGRNLTPLRFSFLQEKFGKEGEPEGSQKIPHTSSKRNWNGPDVLAAFRVRQWNQSC